MVKRLLYLTYISLDETPTSGSSVRPLKMKEAFERLGLDLRVFGGMNNNVPLRRRTVSDITDLLEKWMPDACYIEPPSGPLFYYGDISLIKKLHRIGVPTAIFYRDAYWKYPEFVNEKRITCKEKAKQFVIKRLQIHQWNVFKECMDIIYFPSMTMANEFDCPSKQALPPGAHIPIMDEKKEISKPLQVIFVGGANKNYGTFLTFESFEKLNRSTVMAKLIYVCPEDQWNELGIDMDKYKDWLEVIHTSGETNLEPLYKRADLAILTAPRSFYRDFAVPIKLFEYTSYLKPMLVTDCIETAKYVNDNQAGWVVKDKVDCITKQLESLYNHPEDIIKAQKQMENVRVNNLWINRAEKVVQDLEQVHSKSQVK